MRRQQSRHAHIDSAARVDRVPSHATRHRDSTPRPLPRATGHAVVPPLRARRAVRRARAAAAGWLRGRSVLHLARPFCAIRIRPRPSPARQPTYRTRYRSTLSIDIPRSAVDRPLSQNRSDQLRNNGMLYRLHRPAHTGISAEKVALVGREIVRRCAAALEAVPGRRRCESKVAASGRSAALGYVAQLENRIT